MTQIEGICHHKNVCECSHILSMHMFILRSQGVTDASETNGNFAKLFVNIFTPGTNKLIS